MKNSRRAGGLVPQHRGWARLAGLLHGGLAALFACGMLLGADQPHGTLAFHTRPVVTRPLVTQGLPPQEPVAGEDELERLRAMLATPGGDGRVDRETAIERLLGSPLPAAHRILQDALSRSDDPDALRPAVLTSLQRHLLLLPSTLFGGAGAESRLQILSGYVSVLAPLWRNGEVRDEESAADTLRNAARLALQRAPMRDLENAARLLLAVADDATKVPLLRCLADMQQLGLGPLLAEYVDAQEPGVRAAARTSLQRLTFHEEGFSSREQFATWYEQNGAMRYVDLAERAARRAPRRAERLREELARSRVETAREVVRALTVRTPGLDWAAIQARTLVDDPAVLDACLEQLQQALVGGLPPDDQAVARQVFCKALVQRWRQVPADQVRRRALLLEVASYCARAEEVDLATELTGALSAQLDAPAVEARIAAVRGLRRFPTVDTRTRLVRYATAMLAEGAPALPQLEAALTTLASRTAARWYAPAAADADKPEWLALVRGVCTTAWAVDLRDEALTLALSFDPREQRLPEVFTLLLELVKDQTQDAKSRSTYLTHLQGWRDQQESAVALVQVLHQLLEDPVAELRQLAAENLARLPELADANRGKRIADTITVLRDRLQAEQSPAVLRALVDAMQVCGREPQMPDKAIGALNFVLGNLGNPVPPEQQFRLEPLLTVLATIAADRRADRGQWLGATKQLLQFEKRDSLRNVLQSHSAFGFAQDVTSTDGGQAERAREAVKTVILTALLKPAKDAWNSSEDLLQEALNVRIAFLALDQIDEAQRLDEPQHRLLRLEVELAASKFQEVVRLANAWLGNGSGASQPSRAAMSAEQRDRMRMLTAEAHLGLGKADVAARLLAEFEGAQPLGAQGLDLQCRVARALAPTDLGAAVVLWEKAWRATGAEDPAFRGRLVEWAQAKVRHDPATRGATVTELEPFARYFEAQDCPAELRKAFAELCTPR